MTVTNRSALTSCRMIFRLLVFAFASILAIVSTSCSKQKDVTTDPGYSGFSSLVGPWKTKSQLTLLEVEGKLFLSTTGDNSSPYNKMRILEVLPAGSEIKIEHLIRKDDFERGETFCPTGSLTSGPYAGKSIELDSGLFRPNTFFANTTLPTQQSDRGWAVAPDKLEK